MIRLTRLNHSSLILNADMIEHIQSTPDTLVTMNNGHTYVVLEPPEDVVTLVVDFRQRCQSSQPSQPEVITNA
jgi:flagellar protein FlbD